MYRDTWGLRLHNIRCTTSGGPHHKDHGILGSTSGPPIQGLQILGLGLKGMAWVEPPPAPLNI